MMSQNDINTTPTGDDAAIAEDEAGQAPGLEAAASPRQSARLATKATKESLIAQAELVAMMSPAATAPGEMRALLEQWKQAGRTTKTEDNALWLRFNRAQDQLFTRLSLLREQRQAAAAEAKQRKESLIATAEELTGRADIRQTAETMATLMSQWKQIGPSPNDKELWLRFKAAQDLVFQRLAAQRQQAESDQRQAGDAKRELIAAVQALIGAPDLRQASTELRGLAERFRQTGYAGRDLNQKLGRQFRQAQQDCYQWIRQEPARRRETGQQPTYSRRARLVQQLEQIRSELDRAEASLRSADPVKRSHGKAITVTLGQSGAYADSAAEALRLKIRLADLEKQLARLDSSLE